MLSAYPPMLASRGEVPLNSPEWSYEIKWDGMRALVGNGRIRSRHGTDCTDWFPELRKTLEWLPWQCVFDGEIVSFREGVPCFAALQRRIWAGARREAQRLAAEEPVTLVLFDLLCLDGRSLVRLPWTERRSKLEWNVQPAPGLEISPTFDDGEELWRAVSASGLEGLMAKRRNSLYRPGERSPGWVKLKTKQVTELVVGGWVEGLTGGLTAVMLAEPGGGGGWAAAGRGPGAADPDPRGIVGPFAVGAPKAEVGRRRG